MNPSLQKLTLNLEARPLAHTCTTCGKVFQHLAMMMIANDIDCDMIERL